MSKHGRPKSVVWVNSVQTEGDQATEWDKEDSPDKKLVDDVTSPSPVDGSSFNVLSRLNKHFSDLTTSSRTDSSTR